MMLEIEKLDHSSLKRTYEILKIFFERIFNFQTEVALGGCEYYLKIDNLIIKLKILKNN
jgi:hypothetical protein